MPVQVIMHGDAEPFKVTAQAGEIWLWQLVSGVEGVVKLTVIVDG